MSLASIEEAIADIRAGKMVIVVDDEDRENEGDLVMAAEFATPEAINFMARHGCGLICVPMTGQRLDTLNIPMMIPQEDNSSGFGTAFTVSVEAVRGVTTGISAADRATTIQALIDPASTPTDIARPGHIFPLRARDGGVLVRRGQTEASVDLARLAGLEPAGVICEIMNPDGTMARMPELIKFALEHDLKIVSVEGLVQYRLANESTVKAAATTTLPTRFGTFELTAFIEEKNGKEHLALVNNRVGMGTPLVRVHSECMTGDVFGSARCDCGEQLDAAMAQVTAQGGAIIYLRQEGRDIGLINKLKAYALQDQGLDTVEANVALDLPIDGRDYRAAADMLRAIGYRRIKLLTNNPEKVNGLEQYGIEVLAQMPLELAPRAENYDYMITKRDRMGHQLPNLNGDPRKQLEVLRN